MGLDIYVQWEEMTEDEHRKQITGFRPAPEYGYLRFSIWQYESPVVSALWPKWNGSNDEEFFVTPYVMRRLNKVSKKMAKRNDKDSRDCVKFIDFIRQHRDKRGLKVVFG